MAIKENSGLETFSGRIQKLLGECGFALAKTDNAEIAEFFGVSTALISLALNNKKIPGKMLDSMSEKIAERLNGRFNEAAIAAWLRYGDDAFNLFNIRTGPPHEFLRQVYIQVERIAKKSNVNLDTLPQPILDKLYDKVLASGLQSTTKVDEELVSKIMLLIKSDCF